MVLAYTLPHIDTETGEVIKEYEKFQSKDFEDLMNENSELKEFCYQQICEALYFKI